MKVCGWFVNIILKRLSYGSYYFFTEMFTLSSFVGAIVTIKEHFERVGIIILLEWECSFKFLRVCRHCLII